MNPNSSYVGSSGGTAESLSEAGGVPHWRQAFERAMKQTYGAVDPFSPAGQPGSYWRGEHNGIVGALQTLRENFERELGTFNFTAGTTPGDFAPLFDACSDALDFIEAIGQMGSPVHAKLMGACERFSAVRRVTNK
jgi:hypothetical protein